MKIATTLLVLVTLTFAACNKRQAAAEPQQQPVTPVASKVPQPEVIVTTQAQQQQPTTVAVIAAPQPQQVQVQQPQPAVTTAVTPQPAAATTAPKPQEVQVLVTPRAPESSAPASAVQTTVAAGTLIGDASRKVADAAAALTQAMGQGGKEGQK